MYSYQPFVNVKLLWKINLKIQLEFTVLVFNDNENWCINRFTEAIWFFLPCLMFYTGDVIFQ